MQNEKKKRANNNGTPGALIRLIFFVCFFDYFFKSIFILFILGAFFIISLSGSRFAGVEPMTFLFGFFSVACQPPKFQLITHFFKTFFYGAQNCLGD